MKQYCRYCSEATESCDYENVVWCAELYKRVRSYRMVRDTKIHGGVTMFEEEAKLYRLDFLTKELLPRKTVEEVWQDGAEFGYNKANEWHWIKDGDFPEEEKEYLIYTKKKKLEIRKIHISGDGKNYLTDVFLMRDLESVIAWKEIVPPELEESEL